MILIENLIEIDIEYAINNVANEDTCCSSKHCMTEVTFSKFDHKITTVYNNALISSIKFL